MTSGPDRGRAGKASDLTRADLERAVARELYSRTHLASRVLSDADLEDSRRTIFRDRPPGDVWVFAYGSLIWNPLFGYDERLSARIHGYHRELCLRSILGRGSLDRPGLVLGLDLGGSCHGLVYRLPAAEAEEDLRLLWRREMVVGSYRPRWVKAKADGRVVDALAFVVNRHHPQYAARVSEAEVVETLLTARGAWGTSHAYFLQTLEGLRSHGIFDRHLERIARLLAESVLG